MTPEISPNPTLPAATTLSPRPNATPGKVLAPALALICVAAVNGLFGIGAIKDLVFGVPETEEVVADETASELVREVARDINRPNSVKWTNIIVNLIISVITAVAGVMMLRMRMYPVVMSGAILSMIPFLTLLGCCGIGQAVGIWTIVVLANPEVRGWFKQAPGAVAST